MVGMIVTNGQMGVAGFQGSVAFASNCTNSNAVSSSGFFLHWRPSFGVDFKFKNGRVKRGKVVRALLEGGSNGTSVGGAILKKESDFKPSFDEYLKVMETVKTVRDKRQDITGSEKLTEAPLADGNGKGVKLSMPRGRFEKEKKSRAVENDDGSFNGRDGFKKQNSSRKKVGEMNERSGSKQRSSDGTTKSVRGRETAHRERPKQSTRLEEEREEEEEDIDDYNRGTRSRIENRARSSETFEKKRTDDSRWGYRSPSEVADRKRIDFKSNKSREGFERSRTRNGSPSDERPKRSSQAFEKKGEDKSLNVERAAFRYLGEKDSCPKDGRQRPRAEMDEKIQKLAKSLNGADLDMPEWMFTKMMRSAQIIFTDHSISRVIQILGKFGNWRRVLQVIEWLQVRERFESHKLRYVYTTALYVLGRARRPVEALNLFNAMLEQMSSYPDLVAYRSIAVTLGQAGHMKELFDVIDIMRSPPKKMFKTGALGKWDPQLEPDIIVYNAVLNACVQQKQWEGAFWVMQQLKEKDMNPSVTTHGLFMEAMYACGKYNLVHDFFKKVQKTSIPNALTYRVVVKTLWKEGKLDEAVQTVHEMETRGVVGSAALYYDFARCLCSVGRSREALMQIEKICKVANKPLVVTYTGLIQACLDSGNIKDATYMFNHMKDFCSPNLVTCNIMLKGYLNHGMFKEGEAMFREMLEDANGIKARERGRVLVVPDIYTFNTFLEACVAEKRWDEFEYAFKKMFDHGFHFNSRRHLQLIMAASRAGKEELVEETWNHLAETGRSPPPSLAKERFCMKLDREDYVCALHCISSQSLTRSSDFSKKVWLRLLAKNPAKFQRSTIDRLIHEINDIAARTEQPNPLLDNLLASCEEFSRTSFEAVNT